MRCVRCAVLAASLFSAVSCSDRATVGPQSDGSHLVATGQYLHPVGLQVSFRGRPIDMALAPGGRHVYVKDDRGLVVIELETGQLRQELPITGGSSLTGIVAGTNGSVWFTDAASKLHRVVPAQGGLLKLAGAIDLPRPKNGGEAFGCGIAVSRDEKTAFVCLSRNNSLAIVDLETGKAEEIATDICPYDVALSQDQRMAYVVCWGGAPPRSGARRADSSGTEVEVDERGVGKGGTVAIVDLAARKQTGRVSVGLQPSGLAVSNDGERLWVSNANSDEVHAISLPSAKVVERIVTHIEKGQLFGSQPTDLVLSHDEKRLFVALGGNNAVAVIQLGKTSRVVGLIPTGWFPGSVLLANERLCIANVKGVGSRGGPRENGGHSVYDFKGSIGIVSLPTDKRLSEWTAIARRDAQVGASLRALERSLRKAAPLPVPARTGDPSPIEHVVYILKENRTYDQIFGDLPQGDGDPKLCTFGREVTPNHHTLAERFVLLDNYYCNGVNSADGHAWAMEANATSNLERSFGGWTRSYPFGDDALSYSSSGFVWDKVLAHGLTFRNYGEFAYSEPVPPSSFKEVYDDFVSGARKIKFKHKIGVERARLYANPNYPGWNMGIPDVLRAQIFLDELKEYEAKGSFPNFTIIYLPQDHTAGAVPGMPTAAAYVADNDLALGRIVAGLSKSKFWKKMAIFVNEDDPQNGFDHVDGHRSLCLVVSPYAKRKAVVSEFFNQTSVIHTMERILGIPPMSQMDALSPLMAACFTRTPDFSTYTALPVKTPLDEKNPPLDRLTGLQKHFALQSLKLDLSRPDAGNDDLRNRILWHSRKGTRPYPERLSGAHGRGLAAKGLRLGPPKAE